MAHVTVTPAEFVLVPFDPERIAALVTEVADLVGLPEDVEVRVHVDEQTALGHSEVTSYDPISIRVESGAFEDAKAPRHLSERNVRSLVARHLLRARDRRDPAFAEAPADADLDPALDVAWDVYIVGRCARLGLPVQKPRRQYHFRIRHGFTDAADAAFEQLWTAEGMTWSGIEALCVRLGSLDRAGIVKKVRAAAGGGKPTRV